MGDEEDGRDERGGMGDEEDGRDERGGMGDEEGGRDERGGMGDEGRAMTRPFPSSLLGRHVPSFLALR